MQTQKYTKCSRSYRHHPSFDRFVYVYIHITHLTHASTSTTHLPTHLFVYIHADKHTRALESHVRTLYLSHTLTHTHHSSLSLSLSLSHTHTHTHIYTCTRAHTHTHTHTHTHPSCNRYEHGSVLREAESINETHYRMVAVRYRRQSCWDRDQALRSAWECSGPANRS